MNLTKQILKPIMATIKTGSSEWYDFLNAYEARNLDSIQKNISLQLSEMNTRTKVLAQTVMHGERPEFANHVSAIDSMLRDSDSNTKITDKLINVGGEVLKLVISQEEFLKENPTARAQIKGFIVAYIEAAEASKSNKITDAALKLARTYLDIFPIK